MTFDRFEDITAWQEARTLRALVYRVSDRPPFARDFILRDQIRRSALSGMSNIAEGFGRGSNPEFIYFLAIAMGSFSEVKSHLYAALDEGYVTAAEFQELTTQTDRAAARTLGLLKYLQKSNRRGPRNEPA